MKMDIKLFGKWYIKDIEIRDPGLKRYIVLEPVIIPHSHGRLAKKQFGKSKTNLIERFINKMMVPGHEGKKHKRTSGRIVGKKEKNYKIFIKAMEKIEEKTKKNPIEVFVRAVENAALREEVAGYQVGGIIVRRAVVTSPQRRVDLALRNIAQAAYKKSFASKMSIIDALVDEIIAAYHNDASKSIAIREKERIEREAEGSR